MHIPDHLLTLAIFAPLAGSAAIVLAMLAKPLFGFTKESIDQASRGAALVFSGLSLVFCLMLWAGFDHNATGPQFIDHVVWIKSFSIEYFVGVDGLSVAMVILSGLISFIATIASMPWWIHDDDHHPHFSKRMVPGYLALLLLLQSAMLGVFCALDFFLFYVFWELMLLPMYFLIGIWGGPRKEYAAIKFFLYTLAGSVLMLLAVIGLYYGSRAMPGVPLTLADGSHVEHTFNLLTLAKLGQPHQIGNRTFPGLWHTLAPLMGIPFEKLIWMALFIGFAIKIPMFPFHTWLPDAHVEAPTPISVILAGVLLKMGGYGILRVNFGILPEATRYFADAMAIFGTINIVYGAFVCLAQKDLKKLIAYSSVSHMGFVLLGMAAFTPQALSGAVLQMWTHGIVSPMLFLIVGVIYDRAHHREIEGFGGLAARVPEYTALMGLAFFASMGLPGLCGFISEFLCFLGAFQVWKYYVAVATIGILVTAGFMLRMMEKVFLGKFNEKWSALTDMNAVELTAIVPLTVLTVVLGVYPKLALDLMNATMTNLAQVLR